MSRGYNPYYDATNRPLGKTAVRFSKIELQHLGIAVLALTVGVSFVLAPTQSVLGRLGVFVEAPYKVLAAFLAVGSGFVLHEIAHKVVAIKYGCLAEFRAQMSGLGLAVLIALMIGWIIALPGAVQIYGRVDQKENGIISIAGPATNLVISALCLPFIVFLSGIPEEVLFTVGIVNAVLAGFNLLPFWTLDGKKVMEWNRAAWGAGFAMAILFAVASWLALDLAF